MTALKTKQVTLIWEKDFSEFVSEVYGRPYRWLRQGDATGQDSIEEFSVPSEENEYDSYSLPRLAEWLAKPAPPESDWRATDWWHEHWYPNFEEVVNDLMKRGLLDRGEYALHIWW
ncbi:hypothetical protein ACFRAQ_34445 [Nocardia sp. NPDC056611]|uniref:hypothetical protein n=1 Tax=Nocardia sp. NPDC056611 TaxID=3345877 RepID=UPI00366BF0E4